MSVFDIQKRTERLLLASASPRRCELLSDAGFTIVTCPQDIDESPKVGEKPEALVERLAYQKALAARFEAKPGDVILAADTIVALDGIKLGKPADADDAKRMLRMLSGREHTVSTGVCIIVGEKDTSVPLSIKSFFETTKVEFFELSDAEIDAYVATGEPMDKAGAYGIQGLGRALVKRLDGDYFNVVGLPVARVLRMLDSMID